MQSRLGQPSHRRAVRRYRLLKDEGRDDKVLFYGDDQETVSTQLIVARTLRRMAALQNALGLAAHQALVELFIELAGLLQGVADAEFDRSGQERVSILQARLMNMLVGLAGSIDRSGRSEFRDPIALDLVSLGRIAQLALPPAVTVKRCEGYAFYGLYPEAYLEAARGLPADGVIIGLRSIGTGLAALVAAAAGARTVFTLRPVGHPFSRTIRAGPMLEESVRRRRHRPFVIVDEGPGLSGSSFGGVADWLEGLGVARERIIFMPSHQGELGPQAADGHRQRWSQADRRVVPFEALFTDGDAPAPLHLWFGDLTGPLLEPPLDLSGGGWTGDRADAATVPGREARKYLLRGRNGAFLMKYAGIDAAAQAKFERARQLHAAGFCAQPLALRYGFLIERYLGGEAVADVPPPLLADYLSFRAEHFPAAQAGAPLRDLFAMARYNIGQAAPDSAHDFDGLWSEERLDALQAAVRPVHVDGRLMPWEWLRVDGRIIKTDAIDHSEGHDLVGCQDILWDLAGASVEFDGADHSLLQRNFTRDDPDREELLRLMKICYLGFQIGAWSISGSEDGWARSLWYRGRIAPLLASIR